MTVVVTGTGLVHATGHRPLDILRGEVPPLDEERLRVDETQILSWIPKRNLRKMDRLSKITTAAVAMALVDAGLAVNEHPDEIGLILDTAFGSAGAVSAVLEGIFDPDPIISPLLFPNVVANASSGQAAMALGLRGPSSTLGGIGGLMYAFDLLRAGRARKLVVGGSDEITDVFVRGLGSVGIDKVATSFGDGAAFVVLETAESARSRGAQIYAQIDAISMASDPSFRMSGAFAFSGDGFNQAVDEVLTPEDQVDIFIGVGWNGTELKRREDAFASEHSIPAIWPKTATGEMFACSNSLNAVLASVFLSESRAPTTALISGYDSTRGQVLTALFRTI
ncbi:beta-ketoacyl synthase N-terminal-like domain-containing protein [Diaminobutyricibacter sp. McL0618]|uniref:beta-ketoacyl synthase N-terminal-like domain-containing protein n=1 Tax=Leifsonia sp. McL0618 TaxID=3415677 RepID=UPI003CF3B146